MSLCHEGGSGPGSRTLLLLALPMRLGVDLGHLGALLLLMGLLSCLLRGDLGAHCRSLGLLALRRRHRRLGFLRPLEGLGGLLLLLRAIHREAFHFLLCASER